MDEKDKNIKPNPCLLCGACCAYFRASFYWAECDDETKEGVPVDMTEDLTQFRRVMKGTNQKNPRCIALIGTIGEKVFCSIHERRSSVCRAFDASWVNGEPNERCDKARAAWGLPPLAPEPLKTH
jgi:Fe-S-cluster containining protein